MASGAGSENRRPLHVLHLGAGIFAREAHYPVWKDLAEKGHVVNVGCWSRTQESAERLAGMYGEGTASFYGEEGRAKALAEDQVDAVVITLPINCLVEQARAAWMSHKHVLVEKPLAKDLAQARDILETLLTPRPSAPLYCVAENYRFEPGLHRAQELVARSCGKVLTATLLASLPFQEGSKYQATQWRQESDHIGGVLLDAGVHFIAALRVVLRSNVISVVGSSTHNIHHLAPAPDTLTAALTFASGTVAGLNVTFGSTAYVMELRIVGAEGHVSVKGQMRDGKPGFVVQLGDDGEPEWHERVGVRREIQEFVARSRGDTTSAHPGFDHLEAYNDLATIYALCKTPSTQVVVPPPPHLVP